MAGHTAPLHKEDSTVTIKHNESNGSHPEPPDRSPSDITLIETHHQSALRAQHAQNVASLHALQQELCTAIFRGNDVLVDKMRKMIREFEEGKGAADELVSKVEAC